MALLLGWLMHWRLSGKGDEANHKRLPTPHQGVGLCLSTLVSGKEVLREQPTTAQCGQTG